MPTSLSCPSAAWHDTYRQRQCTVAEAIAALRPGMRLYLSGNAAVPRHLQDELVRTASRFTPALEIVQVLTLGSSAYVAPGIERFLRVNTLFISSDVRAAVNDGRADFTPCLLSEVPKLFHDGTLPLDATLCQVSPPDEHGFCSLGVEVGVTRTAVNHSRLVIAEINECMPRTHGDSCLHISKITHAVPVSYRLVEHPLGTCSTAEQRIGAYCASLIEDGSTLQTGIGGIPDAVLSCLGDKRHLGVHTELFSDGVVDLVERGVIDCERKTLHPGKIIAGFVIGTQKLYDFVDDNPFVELHGTEYINDPFVVARNDRMVAINSAIEIDLSGQVCADSIGPRFYSGVGGQVDFVYGATRARGGKAIIALPSTTTIKGRTVSRIVATLQNGAGVVTSRSHVRYVVTEHGIADLRGKSVRARAQALAAIAAPEFRDELLRAAHDLHWA